MNPTFTYRGIEISYCSASERWEGCPHWIGNGDPEDFNDRVKTLRDAMDVIDEHLAEQEEQDPAQAQVEAAEDRTYEAMKDRIRGLDE